MGYLQGYVAEETAGEYKAGRISYKELLRRFTLLTGSVVAAVALAVSLGCTASTPPTATTAPPTATAAPLPTSTSLTQTATPTRAPGVTVPPDDPSIEAGKVTFENAGVTLMGYLARPKAGGPYPAVLVIHENRGLLPHFEDVARRLAKEGYVALALDLLSREGGTATFTDQAQATATLGRAGQDRLVTDMNGAVRYLEGLPFVRADRVGCVGFCFGGGMAWLLSVRNQDIKAAVPFYGPRPPLDEVPNLRAPVLGLYGGNDTFINPMVPDLEAALKQNNKTYKFITYPGAGHAFFNNTGQNYNAGAADAGWREALAWFAQYLKS